MKEETQKLIGTVLDETAERDAIHIAVAPLVAAEKLYRGMSICLVYGTKNQAQRSHEDHQEGSRAKPIGIVDPFLKSPVGVGERFYCFLFPNTVTGMRHHWSHPAFDDVPPTPTNESEVWLHTFADKWNFNYDDMIAEAQSHDSYVVAHGVDLHYASELDDGDEALFWEHLSRLTGKTFDQEHRNGFTWSCSC